MIAQQPGPLRLARGNQKRHNFNRDMTFVAENSQSMSTQGSSEKKSHLHKPIKKGVFVSAKCNVSLVGKEED